MAPDRVAEWDVRMVEVVGRVVHEPRLSGEAGTVDYCSFLLDDGSGALRGQAFRGAARDLALAGRVPSPGALVDVAGSLMVTAGEVPRLRLQAAEQLQVVGSNQDG